MDDYRARAATPDNQDPALDWLSLAIFAGGVQQLDAALEQAVGPAVAATCKELDLRRWYFVRYVDGRGPHVRLDVLTADTDAAQRLLSSRLEQGLEGLQTRPVRDPLLAPPASWRKGSDRCGVEPSSHVAQDDRSPQRLAAAEELFQISSETVLTLLPSLPRGRERVACGLRLMTDLAELGLPSERRAGFWDDVARGWTGDDERGKRLSARLASHAQREARALVDEARALSDDDPIKAALAIHTSACEAMLAQAPQDEWPALVREHAHLTANRLGVAPLEEALLASVLAQGETPPAGQAAPADADAPDADAKAPDETATTPDDAAEPPAGDSVVVIEGVTKRGDEHSVLDDVSIEVRAGEGFAILGPEGAGKSSLLGVAAGLRVASGGTVRVLGLDPRTDRERLDSEIGTPLPDEELVDELTARENLDLRARLAGDRSAEVRSADEVLSIIGLSERAGVPALELEPGDRRLLAIGVALARYPRVVLLDEPTAGLSPIERERVWAVMDLLRRDGVTVVFTTSSLQDAVSASDRVALFLGGAVAEVSPPSDIAEQFPERVLHFRTTDQPDAMLLDDLPDVQRVDVSEQPGHYNVEVTTLQPDELLKLVGNDPAFPEIVWVASGDVDGTFTRPTSGASSET